MTEMKQHLKGELRAPGDKSISHRALIFAALSKGRSTVSGLSPADDCRSSINCLRALGLEIEPDGGSGSAITIESAGLRRLHPPVSALDAGNSGTTIRLMSGLAAGLPFQTTFDGDASLRSRPMSRVLDPLGDMGARVNFPVRAGYAPFSIQGGSLRGITYQAPVASAQVQTALLLAGLQAEGETLVALPGIARDHTLRLFQHLNVPHRLDGPGRIAVARLPAPIEPYRIAVPADISSAAFFMVAAALLPDSAILLRDIGMNPGRILALDVLRTMGAELNVQNERTESGEPVADISVRFAGRLSGVTIGGAEIAAGIDEIPILALAGAFCQGVFSVRGAAELRVKESDRLQAIVSNLRAVGAKIDEFPDGFEIEGSAALSGGSSWPTFGDHRLAMTGLVAGLVCSKPVAVDDKNCVNVSYPDFEADLAKLLKPL